MIRVNPPTNASGLSLKLSLVGGVVTVLRLRSLLMMNAVAMLNLWTENRRNNLLASNGQNGE